MTPERSGRAAHTFFNGEDAPVGPPVAPDRTRVRLAVVELDARLEPLGRRVCVVEDVRGGRVGELEEQPALIVLLDPGRGEGDARRVEEGEGAGLR